MLWNACPFTTYPTSSSPLTTHHIFSSKNSSPLQTGLRTYPHLSQMPHSLKRNPVPIPDMCSLFYLSSLNPFCSSTGPSVCWSPFLILYVFLFRFRSCSTSAMQHWLSPRFPFLYHTILHLILDWFSTVVAYPEPLFKAPILPPLCTIKGHLTSRLFLS